MAEAAGQSRTISSDAGIEAESSPDASHILTVRPDISHAPTYRSRLFLIWSRLWYWRRIPDAALTKDQIGEEVQTLLSQSSTHLSGESSTHRLGARLPSCLSSGLFWLWLRLRLRLRLRLVHLPSTSPEALPNIGEGELSEQEEQTLKEYFDEGAALQSLMEIWDRRESTVYHRSFLMSGLYFSIVLVLEFATLAASEEERCKLCSYTAVAMVPGIILVGEVVKLLFEQEFTRRKLTKFREKKEKMLQEKWEPLKHKAAKILTLENRKLQGWLEYPERVPSCWRDGSVIAAIYTLFVIASALHVLVLFCKFKDCLKNDQNPSSGQI